MKSEISKYNLMFTILGVDISCMCANAHSPVRVYVGVEMYLCMYGCVCVCKGVVNSRYEEKYFM